jgi:hypothetical protein
MSIAETLSEQELLQQEYDRTVREDIEKFRDQAQSLLDGKITDDELARIACAAGFTASVSPASR